MRKNRISQYKQKRLQELFVAGATARTAAELVGVNKTTLAYYFHRLRVLIADYADEHSMFEGEVEIDESYFGGKRKGKRGWGSAGKVPVFGLLKRGGRVYTRLISNAKSDTLMPIITAKIKPDSLVYTDNFASYDVLEVSDFKHYRINHSTEFVDAKNGQNPINGIENFWNQAKRHMRKFNGIPKEHFELFLKECEWRFNTPGVKDQLHILKQRVKGKI
ncbi:IS1595 family transposase [Photorhabdus kleinii]|uniref:IS1595 family transposase n=1 Tax=Photorhabdus kleinii TaxID=768034 RepID=UPI0021D49DAC|nr:IS1595 family transposase [Photorhabdus kleinii]MCT8345073.1 IS1595 family transposase [Photorhabdus kleinii]